MSGNYLIAFADRADVVFRTALMLFFLVAATPFLVWETLFSVSYRGKNRIYVLFRNFRVAYRSAFRCVVNSFSAKNVEEFKRMNAESNYNETLE